MMYAFGIATAVCAVFQSQYNLLLSATYFVMQIRRRLHILAHDLNFTWSLQILPNSLID
jgi:site-specific DNA-cytosine methylase